MRIEEPGVFRLSYRLQGKPHNPEFDRDEVVLGRHPNCDVQVSGEAISRFHAKILRDESGWKIIDLKSVNGTQVSNITIQGEHRLKDKDVVTLGSLELSFHVVRVPEISPQAVVVDDSDEEPLMTQCINVDQFKQMLAGTLSTTVPPAPTTDGSSVEHATTTTERTQEGESASHAYEWALPVVSQASEKLLSCGDLDEMLNGVLDLVFDNLPAERGSIFLYGVDEDDNSPRVTRTRSPQAGERFAISNTIVKRSIQEKNAVLCQDPLADEKLAQQQSIIFNRIRSVMCAPLYRGDGSRVEGMIYIDTQNPLTQFRHEDLQVLTTLAMLSCVAVEQARLRENVLREQRIRNRLERYSSPGIVDRIVHTSQAGLPEEMLAEEREASILFLDLVSFTTFSEELAPKEVTRVLNRIFGEFTEAVFEYDGTLDKFTGDGMMAIFGAPLEQEDHAVRSVHAALLMQDKLEQFNSDSELKLRMRIGINSGQVIAGDIGSPQRKDYTVIGDTVNTASRLESQVAQPGQIVIGPHTHELVAGHFECKELDVRQLKGKQKSVIPYLVLGKCSE